MIHKRSASRPASGGWRVNEYAIRFVHPTIEENSLRSVKILKGVLGIVGGQANFEFDQINIFPTTLGLNSASHCVWGKSREQVGGQKTFHTYSLLSVTK